MQLENIKRGREVKQDEAVFHSNSITAESGHARGEYVRLASIINPCSSS